MASLRILGLDPGSYACGVAVVALTDGKIEAIAYDVVRQARSASSRKLSPIYEGVRAFIEQFSPAHAAVEKVFTAYNPVTAVKLGEARGVALLAMEQAGLEIFPYAATQVKKAVVGYGHAEKEQMQQMVQRTLDLPQMPPSDAADALALAMCHAASIGFVASIQQSSTRQCAEVAPKSSAPDANTVKQMLTPSEDACTPG